MVTFSLMLLYWVEVRFEWSFELISFISCCFFDCFLTELYSHLHKLFCTIILDFIPLVNKLLILIPYVGFKIEFKPFSVNLSWKHFSKNSVCDKNWIFLFLIRSRQNVSFFFSSSLLIFLPLWNLYDVRSQHCHLDWLTFLTNQILLCTIKVVQYVSTPTFCTVHLHVQGDNRIPAEYCL